MATPTRRRRSPTRQRRRPESPVGWSAAAPAGPAGRQAAGGGGASPTPVSTARTADQGADFGGCSGGGHDGHRQPAHGDLAGAVRGSGTGSLVEQPARLVGCALQSTGFRLPDRACQSAQSGGQRGAGDGRYGRRILSGDGCGTGAGNRDLLDGEFGVEQPLRQLGAADPGPHRGGIHFVFDLVLHQQRGLVEPGGPDPQAPPAPLVDPTGLHATRRWCR